MTTRQAEATSDRNVSHNLEAERALLGSVLLDSRALDSSLELGVFPEDLYSQANQLIYQRMIDLAEKSRPIDLVSLSEEINQDGLLEKAGGAGYLSALTDGVPIGSNSSVSEYCRIIKEKSTIRRIINAANNVVARALEGGVDSKELIETGQSQFFEIAEETIKTRFVSFGEAVKSSFGSIDDLMNGRFSLDGVKTGFSDFDLITGCLRNKDLVVLAARPSVGKTALALNIAANAALRLSKSIGIFSLEMSTEQLLLRMLCSEARIDSFRLRTGTNSREDWARMTTAIARLAAAPIYFDDCSSLSLVELRSKARRLKVEKNIDLLIVDYLQLVAGEGENRTQEVSSVSRGLKALAKELGIPVLALVQLSRAVEIRKGVPKPILSDLRESGSIEQDADVVAFLYRLPDDDPDADGSRVGLNIGKQRNGPIGDGELVFLKRYSRFENKLADSMFDSKAEAANDRSS
jgi:replicative DNA helicase